MTPHIEAKKEEIAKIVIMPGDPIRAKLIVEKYLTDYKLVNNIRGISAYTGKYKDHDITVMASGMGIPSMGIYSYELFKFYDVDMIIKVGTCGTYDANIKIGDIVLINGSYSLSTYAKLQDNVDDKIIYADKDLNNLILSVNKDIKLLNAHSSDVFYEDNVVNKDYLKYDCKVVEMESFSLFHNAHKFNKKAAQLLTVTDNLVTGERADSFVRQNNVMTMVEIALESAIKYDENA